MNYLLIFTKGKLPLLCFIRRKKFNLNLKNLDTFGKCNEKIICALLIVAKNMKRGRTLENVWKIARTNWGTSTTRSKRSQTHWMFVVIYSGIITNHQSLIRIFTAKSGPMPHDMVWKIYLLPFLSYIYDGNPAELLFPRIFFFSKFSFSTQKSIYLFSLIGSGPDPGKKIDFFYSEKKTNFPENFSELIKFSNFGRWENFEKFAPFFLTRDMAIVFDHNLTIWP